MERVVITGIGLVTPNGIGTGESWKSIVEGRAGIAPITLFDASAYNSRIAGEVKNFDPVQFIEKKKIKEMARFIQLSMAASKLAVQDGHLELSDEDRETAGCFIGVGLGGLEGIEAMGRTLVEKGPSKISPYFIPSVIANLAAGQVSIALGLRGPSYCNTSACSSSAHSIGEAVEWIRRGRADLIVAGGAESTITGLGVGGFCAMFALSRRNDDPGRASRPFDKGRDGFVIGEGAGTLILESLTRAKKRGATIYAEITGYGATSDAHHLTQPAPEGAGAQRAMRMALADAKLDPNKVDYMNAHGTSTPQGDIQESRAIEKVFGDHALSKKLWVSSTKSMMGHMLGGAGAVEAALSALAIAKGVVPPTINLEDQDPECRLDYVPNVARERRIDHAMSNSFGFGGTNCSLLLSRAMKCPFCGRPDSGVVDSRVSATGEMVRRRRSCDACGRRFTTYERLDEILPTVVKKDGRREKFDRQKLIRGLSTSCSKRPVSVAQIDAMADAIERDLQERGEQEISSALIGEKAMARLRGADEVAYVRFASVYRSFRDIDEFMAELGKLVKAREAH